MFFKSISVLKTNASKRSLCSQETADLVTFTEEILNFIFCEVLLAELLCNADLVIKKYVKS